MAVPPVGQSVARGVSTTYLPWVSCEVLPLYNCFRSGPLRSFSCPYYKYKFTPCAAC